MTEYDNTNSGVLYKNDRKESDRHPDYRGSVNVEGTEYWLSAWIKTAGPQARNPGSKFMSLALTKKEEQTQYDKNPDGTTKPPQPEIGKDDIPF